MSKETATVAEARQGFSYGGLPVFDEIAQVFLGTLTSHSGSGDLFACLDYLDGAVVIDGASYKRRDVVLAIEDLGQQLEAPLALRSETCSIMQLLKLDPVPELKLYREIATAILRIDAALHLTKMNNARGPVYH
ncbi:MAG: hypothetical protein ACLPJW_20415 [Rhodomicrobium sp.]